jgi:hypothetical protein
MALPTACDEQGRYYVKLHKLGPEIVGPLLRISAKGIQEAEFETSGDLNNIFAVRPDGGVAMVRLDKEAKVIDNFGPDGKRESSIRLDRPPTPFFPSQLAVFHSGEILLAGPQYHPGYKASTAIYDPTGHLLKQLVLDEDAELERAIEAGDVRYTRSPRAITADDGLVYLMRATSPVTVYAISAAGVVVHKIVITAPTEQGWPDFGMRVANGKLALGFYRSCDSPMHLNSCHGVVFTVVDVATGQRLADYETDNESGGSLACYAPEPDRFFTFGMSPDQHHLAIIESAAK